VQEDNKTIKDKKGQKNVLSTDKISFYQNESWNLFTDSNKFPLQHQKDNVNKIKMSYRYFPSV
jgi:hypothetical protein